MVENNFGAQPAPQHPIPNVAPQHKKGQDEQYLSLSREISDLLSRLRLSEERYANLRREHQTTSHNMIENHQTLSKAARKLNDSILELKRNIQDIKEQLATMQGELSDSAKLHELKVLQRYVELWEPMQFLTRNDAENMIEAAARKFYKHSELKDKDEHREADSAGSGNASSRDEQ